ncbi:phage major capsid protein [Candidatus Pacearchaeota archaeon]|nr:phage major capsid protein [Candidatus Pacearchaeota archaeon]
MATQTLAEAKKLINNQIVVGVAEDIITTNPVFSVIPWTGYEGQAILVNRENALGDSQVLAIGGTITAKAAATYTQTPFTATTVIGDAEMNGLVQAQSSSAGVNQMAIEVSSKAKSVGRLIQTGIATGTGVAPQYNSLHSLCDAGQYTTASATQVLSFALLDELLDLVKAKDGEVDFIMMPARTLRSYKILVRALGGTDQTIVYTMPNGTKRTVSTYEGIPIFQNDYLSVAETANGAALTTGALTSVWAGCWDDGSNKVGVSLIHPMGIPAGIAIENVGALETKDEQVMRVKSYSNLAMFNRKGLARLTSISN